jgi:autoinducer 2 (AI-2) kinase
LPGRAFLVVDFGTGGTKCVLFSDDGEVLRKDTVPVEFRFAGAAIDFDPKKVWDQICMQLRTAAAEAEKLGVEVVAASSTSMREGNVFYDGEGKELLAVPNIDGRAWKEADEVAKKFGETIYERSGHWPMAGFLVCRLEWMKKNRPELRAKTRKASMINDWVVYRLSGKLVSEPTNGCESAVFDLRKRDWSDEIMDEVGIDSDLLPEVVEGGTIVGEVSGEAAEATGLPRSTRVVVGAADTEAALVGCRALEPGKVAAVAGTTTPVQGVTKGMELDSKRRTWTCCHVVPGTWVVESNAGATGMVFDWWSRTTKESYDELTKQAANIPPGSSGVSSLVGALVFNARDLVKMRGELRGMGPWTPPGSVGRAIMEGTCYAVRANLEQVEQVMGRRFEEVIFCGGSAESQVWSQIQADVLNRPLIRYQGRQATARGAMALCQVAVGDSKNLEEAVAMGGSKVEPWASAADAYEPLYHQWLREVA